MIFNVMVNDKPVCTIDGDEITWLVPKEEFEEMKKSMMKNTGEHMSRYLKQHPEATLWQT